VPTICYKAGAHVPFGKPRDASVPTPHLYCCNCPTLPKGADWNTHELVKFCREHANSTITDFYSVPEKPWAVLTFGNAEAAAAAMIALQAIPVNGRAVHVQYAVPIAKNKVNSSVSCAGLKQVLEASPHFARA
jgi:hypothetical protein